MPVSVVYITPAVPSQTEAVPERDGTGTVFTVTASVPGRLVPQLFVAVTERLPEVAVEE